MSSSPSDAPPPTFAEIPLPPGMTLEQFQSLQGSLVTIAITVAVVFGVLLWDYLNLLPAEIKVYQNSSKGLWRTPVVWAFVVLRYSGILATLPSLFFTSVQSDHCQVAVVTSQVGVVLVVAASGIIFCYRVVAIWGGNKFIYAFVGIMFVIMVGCWCVVASRYHAITGPHTPFGSNCQMLPIVPWAPICYASSVAFDSAVLLLTIFKLRANTNSATASKVGYLIYRDSLMYFFITTATNLAVLVIQGLGPGFQYIKPLAMPFSTLMTATMGTRVYLNLKLFQQRQAQAKQGLPFPSTSSASGRLTPMPDRRAMRPKPVPPPPLPAMPSGLAMHSYPISSNRNSAEAPFSAYASHKHEKSVEMTDFIQEPISPRQ